VGSLVSIFGVLVFFWVLLEIFTENNFFFQYRNTYVICLNAKGALPFTSKKGAGQNIYVFPKYNFFHMVNAGGLFV
jgi:hypothetical protein